ncbi:MAG: 5-(carboxyamino)imidazole ribonucleotide mutase, partial [Nitrospinota bacterium]
EFEVTFEITVASAHRSPRLAQRYARGAKGRGLKAIIAGAGGAAHLAGVLASETTLPVIGVPIDSSPLGGLDALLSTAQMPGGVPVAAMAIGKAGARNAALLAIEILALSDEKLHRRLLNFRRRQARHYARSAEKLSRHGPKADR